VGREHDDLGDAPGGGGECTASVGSVDPDMEVGWDVTALVAGGSTINLAVVSDDSNGVHYLSKEGGSAALAPRLVVETLPAPDGGGDDSVDDGGGPDAPDAPLDGDQGSDADARLDGPRDGAVVDESGSGCSCRAAGGSSSSSVPRSSACSRSPRSSPVPVGVPAPGSGRRSAVGAAGIALRSFARGSELG